MQRRKESWGAICSECIVAVYNPFPDFPISNAAPRPRKFHLSIRRSATTHCSSRMTTHTICPSDSASSIVTQQHLYLFPICWVTSRRIPPCFILPTWPAAIGSSMQTDIANLLLTRNIINLKVWSFLHHYIHVYNVFTIYTTHLRWNIRIQKKIIKACILIVTVMKRYVNSIINYVLASNFNSFLSFYLICLFFKLMNFINLWKQICRCHLA